MTQQRRVRSSVVECSDLRPAQGIMVGVLMSVFLWLILLMPL